MFIYDLWLLLCYDESWKVFTETVWTFTKNHLLTPGPWLFVYSLLPPSYCSTLGVNRISVHWTNYKGLNLKKKESTDDRFYFLGLQNH